MAISSSGADEWDGIPDYTRKEAAVDDLLCDERFGDALDTLLLAAIEAREDVWGRGIGAWVNTHAHLVAPLVRAVDARQVTELRAEVERLRRFASNGEAARREAHRALNRAKGEVRELSEDRDSEERWAVQYCAERDALTAEVTELRAQRDAALALHQPIDVHILGRRCRCCTDSDEVRLTWPCPTARALGMPDEH